MIEKTQRCYLYKLTKDQKLRIYHRVAPNMHAVDNNSKWNSTIADDAGMLTKEQWEKRASKWLYNEGWMLESQTGEVEALTC